METTPTIRRRGLRMEADAEELAVSLKTYRLRQNKSQNDLANEWNCSRYTLMRMEAGKKVSWEMMYRVFNQLTAALQKEGRQL